jgi:hypothetical protein
MALSCGYSIWILFSIIGLYIDIYGHGMFSMRFWLFSKRTIVIGTDCKSSCKSNYHMITATTVLNVISHTSSVICRNLYVGMFRHYVVLRRCDCWWHLMASRITVLTASSFYKYTHNPWKWTVYNSFYSTYISICGDFIVHKIVLFAKCSSSLYVLQDLSRGCS